MFRISSFFSSKIEDALRQMKIEGTVAPIQKALENYEQNILSVIVICFKREKSARISSILNMR